MSIAGIIATHPDAPVDLDRILRGVTIGHARSQRRWAGEGARLGVADGSMLATGPGGRACVFDGRLDYLTDLRRALGDEAPAGDDPAAFALAAHARWGDDFADHLTGDWACAIWDGGSRRLLLGLDPMGTRALHFHVDAEGTIRLATDARALHADPAVPRVLDAERAALWLALTAPPESASDRTMFRDVARVAPGTTAVWSGGRVRSWRWWRPLAAPMLHLSGQDAYAEALRTTFEAAVAERIRSDDRIGSHLSGGLDSGSVTAVAATMLARERRRLTAFTAVPVHPHPGAERRFTDEWGHAAALAAMHANIDHVAVSNDDAPLMEVLERRTPMQDMPLLNLSNSVWVEGIDRQARDRGITVMLTGAMGNMTLSYDGSTEPTRLIRRGRWLAALRLLIAYRRHMGSRWLGIPAVYVDALLPRPWAAALRRATGQQVPRFSDWSALDPAFLAATGHGHLMEASGDLREVHRGDGRATRLAVLARSDFRAEFVRSTRRRFGIDTRDPTMDRRLFELCLSIPEGAFLHGGVPRSLGRRAMHDLLPPVVRDETRRGLQAADWAVPFDAALPELRAEVARLRASTAASTWLDLDRIDRSLGAWRGPQDGQRMTLEMIAVTRAIALGRFARGVEGGNA